MSASNMYRTGDYVYVDAGPVRCFLALCHLLKVTQFFSPFGVRRIDELQKSASGNVEMEVNLLKFLLFKYWCANLMFKGDDLLEKN